MLCLDEFGKGASFSLVSIYMVDVVFSKEPEEKAKLWAGYVTSYGSSRVKATLLEQFKWPCFIL